MSSPRANSHLTVSRKRKLCEISSLNTYRPAKRRHGLEDGEVEETNMWTTVKRYLKDPAGHPVPSVSCPICSLPIAIRGIHTLEPCPWKLADGSQRVGAVLPCAHIFCSDCINGHIAAQKELSPDGQRSCPCCRASILFPGCPHTIPPQRLPVASCEDASMVPLTIPELQPTEYFVEDCWDCVSESCTEYLDVAFSFVSGSVHGAEYLPGEGPLEWEHVVESSQMLLWNYMERQRDSPSWRNGSVPVEPLGLTFAGEERIPIELLRGFNDPDRDAVLYNPDGVAFCPQ